jgi:hypothetical protein
MTSFFLEELTNIKDAWKIHIKFALDFFNSIKTIISVCASRIYISTFNLKVAGTLDLLNHTNPG